MRTDRDRCDLRGPVSSCCDRTLFVPHCGADACDTEERSFSSVLEFRSDGSLARKWYRNPNGSEGSVTCEPEAAGARSKVVRLDPTEQPATAHRAFAVDGSNAFYFAPPGCATATTTYDDDERPTALLFHDADGRELDRVRFVYDEHGGLVQEIEHRSDEGLPPDVIAAMEPAELEALHAMIGFGADVVRQHHRYDEQGRRIETRTFVFGDERSQTMAYNDRGDKIVEIADGSEARFHYEYDAHGNWIEKRVESRAGTDGPFSLNSLERRILTYHPAEEIER